MLYSTKYLSKIKGLFSPEKIGNRAVVETVNSLMLATGIYRLFTKDDFKEFFERLHLFTIRYALIESFFLDDDLMFVIFRGQIYPVNQEDVMNCIGLTSGTSPRKMEDRSSWLNNIQQRVNDSILEALDNRLVVFIKDIEVRDVAKNGIKGQELIFKNKMKGLKEEDYKNAKILAESMLGDVPDTYFSDWIKANPDAITKYNQDLEKIKNIPHFEFSELRSDQLKKIDIHFSKFPYSEVFHARRVILLTHLAWAWANGYVFQDEHGVTHLENYVWLDGETLQLEGGGYNFEEVKERFQLEELFEVLKNDYSA